MSALLAQVLLAALACAILGTVALFLGEPRRPRSASRTDHLVVAAGAGLAPLLAGALLGAPATRSLLAAGAMAGAVLALAPAARAWTARGLLAWSTTLIAGVAYLGYVLAWTTSAGLGLPALVGGLMLWLLELFVFVLAVGYIWELVDVLGRWEWASSPRVVRGPIADRSGAGPAVMVSLHVPIHNEPPDLVIETLRSLLELDHPDFEVLVLDNNTVDPELWRPVETFCAGHDRLRFFHLEDWPGYKSGALNFGLEQTDPRAELIGVIDADYRVDPDFLSACVPLFSDPDLAFAQTPQDYRDWEHDPYFRRLYHSYAYFFDVSQRSRNERGGAIFGGTMGLIRRSALVEVGGWDEWCITEDAELSLRLLRAGWQGVHVPESFGRGLMPLTFEALKRQRYRWCFGGVQMLRLHLGSLLPGRPGPGNQLTWSQRWAYLVGGLQWFGDLAGVLFSAFLIVGALDAVAGGSVVLRRFSGLLLIGVLGLVLLGSLRSVALIRRVEHATWREAFGALGIWLGLGPSVARASVRGLVAREGVFLRTPKTRGRTSWADVLRGNLVESVLVLLAGAGAVLGLVAAAHGSAGGALVAGLLMVQAVSYLAAPWNSWAAARADLTEEQDRRRAALPSWIRVTPGVRRWGILPAVGLTVASAVLIVFAAPAGLPSLGRLTETVRELPHRSVPRVTTTDRPGGAATSTTTTGGATGTGTVAPAPAPVATASVTSAPSAPSARPTAVPSTVPTPTTPAGSPTVTPTATPSVVSGRPSPTQRPTSPSSAPTTVPTHPTGPSGGPGTGRP